TIEVRRSEKRNANSAAAVRRRRLTPGRRAATASSSWPAASACAHAAAWAAAASSSDDASAQSGDSKEKDAALGWRDQHQVGGAASRSGTAVQGPAGGQAAHHLDDLPEHRVLQRVQPAAPVQFLSTTCSALTESAAVATRREQPPRSPAENLRPGTALQPSGWPAELKGSRRTARAIPPPQGVTIDLLSRRTCPVARRATAQSGRTAPHARDFGRPFPARSASHVQLMIDSFGRAASCIRRYLLQLLHETRAGPGGQAPNVHSGQHQHLQAVSRTACRTFTEPGYVFNGDFVDRGANSVEVPALLFALPAGVPDGSASTGGNHEDHVMNCATASSRRHSAQQDCQLFAEVFAWMPLATTGTDTCRRLRPPGNDGEKVDYLEWRQVLDLLWSDPKPQAGCRPQHVQRRRLLLRPDVTESFLRKNKLTLLSHEWQAGWLHEFCHDGAVLTVFSASNYYEEGSNRGGRYVKFDSSGKPHIVQYMASRSRRLPAMDETLRDLDLPGGLCGRPGRVRQERPAAVHDLPSSGSPWTLAALPAPRSGRFASPRRCTRSKESELETIFRIMDKDSSGHISLEEFRDSCRVLSEATGRQMADDNRSRSDGQSDGPQQRRVQSISHEFLEAFRIVDNQTVRLVGTAAALGAPAK
uniref:EF-hand domain-containing protein n=1 Tax=Macrostomum lignano TaxID=282301 RepID=A0A1I8JRK6_9PLAT